jgi:Tfp pilus assembly protein PilE
MGQQQLLLIILGVIIVGIAIAVGITMFRDNSVSSNRDAMSTDLLHLAAKARHYYKRPTSMGGGGTLL